MAGAVDKKLSVLSVFSEECSKERQSVLWRDLEVLLDLKTSALRSDLLALPRELRDHIFQYAIDARRNGPRRELHTCFWGAEMVHEPWNHDTFGYAACVPKKDRLDPRLLLINRQIRQEVLETLFRTSKLTLHAGLRNSNTNNFHFDYSPHIPRLPMLKHLTHIRFYVEWNYTVTHPDPIHPQIRITDNVVTAMDNLLASPEALESIELSILFFWRYRSGKLYHLTMQNLFDLEDVFKRHAEQQWLHILKRNATTDSARDSASSAGVGYKLLPESKGTEASGAMEIFVAQNVEDAMQHRRQSTADFYGNYMVEESLPQPSYTPGAMI